MKSNKAQLAESNRSIQPSASVQYVNPSQIKNPKAVDRVTFISASGPRPNNDKGDAGGKRKEVRRKRSILGTTVSSSSSSDESLHIKSWNPADSDKGLTTTSKGSEGTIRRNSTDSHNSQSEDAGRDLRTRGPGRQTIADFNDFKDHKYNPTRLNCLDKCIFRHLSARKQFLHSAACIKSCMQSMDAMWAPILSVFEWPKLPGGQHSKVMGFNYITHSIWLFAYAAGTAYHPEEEKEEYYRATFAQLITLTEEIGILLQKFVQPLNQLQKVYYPFDQMTHLVGDLEWVLPENYGADAKDLFVEILMPLTRRFKPKDYLNLRIYTRDLRNYEWEEFKTIRFSEQMASVKRGLEEVILNLTVIMHNFPIILTMLNNAGKKSCLTKGLKYHIHNFHRSLTTMIQFRKLTPDDFRAIRYITEVAQTNTLFMIEQSYFFVYNMWEIVLMTRLCYEYVRSSPMANGTMKSIEVVIEGEPDPDLPKTAKNKPKKQRMSPGIEYTWQKFFCVNCAGILRKVPVIVENRELAIHLEGYSNPKVLLEDDAVSRHTQRMSHDGK